jgi:putative SOS response-associated peptidase YedK
MCTAYELGKRGGSHTGRANAEALDYLMELEARIVRPTLSAPVLMPDGNLREMSWGFRRQVKGASGKSVKRTIVNSREDKLGTWMWKESFRDRRCLIPAAGFFEWTDGPGGKVPLRFQDPAGQLLWIAGIWEHDREHGECFSMVTTVPTPAIESVHDRMPAVLTPQQQELYLDHALNEFGPSGVELEWVAQANFLKRAEPGELF